jgi:hypothetical protein
MNAPYRPSPPTALTGSAVPSAGFSRTAPPCWRSTTSPFDPVRDPGRAAKNGEAAETVDPYTFVGTVASQLPDHLR